MPTVEVFCTLQVEGIHNWPECPFDEVSYLKTPHRHVFHIKAFKPVLHNDRDTEFIILKHKIYQYIIESYGKTGCYGLNVCNFGPMSCEMIGDELCKHFNLSRCEVSEDGENGAIVTSMIKDGDLL